ncbi:uncharacterized protein LOC133337683 [Musca vetustissima]|uniref:uncharacterized protein LOC133337683 n=1 Tax=Musca vetustissima TaxID=27455 RepID=UPI002AB731E4|nr:uncharacterized protein LOC133337683 [Musca vetustissima]
MDVILPFKVKNEKKFFDCAFKMGIDEMSAHKFLFIIHKSDVDIFPKMGEERVNILLYFWEMCEDYKLRLKDDDCELPEELEFTIKILVAWSLDVWFSKEWDRCKLLWKHALIHCLNRARSLFMRMPDMLQINWDFLLLFNVTPWQVAYLKSLNVTKEKTLEDGALTIEKEETMASNEDMAYLKMEQLPLIVLRLVKLFDQSSIDMVKTLCMKVIAAWNKVYHNEMSQTGGSRLPYVPPEDKRCLLYICHIYLMAVYEADDNKGYVIDNMINNIRFYSQGLQNSYAMDNMKYTPARFIALTCTHLRVHKKEFFDFFIWNSIEVSPVNLFGVISQAYKSYLYGNLLMELNNMNDEDFAANVALYKRLMNAYINEREKSEQFIMDELQKQEAQHYAHNIIQTVQNMTDFKSKICKGNRMSNIGNYENTDDPIGNSIESSKTPQNAEEQDDLRVDPIFQNIPNNEEILYYVYDALSKKTFHGWHFAKIVLLFKIIGHELNMIETWRYHPGLTTSFMLNLETKLSQHYMDLAKIFQDHPFIEQEFWLTAFYLNPTSYNYEAIKRLGIRNNRKRTDEQGRWVTGKDKIEAKYGLLSSTIDVKAISSLSNHDEQHRDYEPLFQALSSLRLPSTLIKDLITVVFLARNKSFSWAVEWNELRRRCKALMTNAEEKKRFVELNMAEANDRLKYLNIDYEKYKNRPQLDYGSIEQGYENLINAADMDDDTEESEEEDDFEDDEDVYESKRGRGNKKSTEVIEDDNSQEDDPYLTGKRRTRATAAAALANFLYNNELSRRRRRKKPDEEEQAKKEQEEEDAKLADNEEKSNESKSACESESTNISATAVAAGDDDNSKTSEITKKNIKECLKERPVLVNPTQGFQPLIDLWNVDKSDLDTVDSDCVSLMESSSVLNRFSKLKNITREINPAAMCVEEDVREMQMFTDYREITTEFNQVETPANTSFKAITIRSSKPIEEPTNMIMDISIEENSIKLEPDDTKEKTTPTRQSQNSDDEKTNADIIGTEIQSKDSECKISSKETALHNEKGPKNQSKSSMVNEDGKSLDKPNTVEQESIDNKSEENKNKINDERINECVVQDSNEKLLSIDIEDNNPKLLEGTDDNINEIVDLVKTSQPDSCNANVAVTNSESSVTEEKCLNEKEHLQDQNEDKSAQLAEEPVINDAISSENSMITNVDELFEVNQDENSNPFDKIAKQVLKLKATDHNEQNDKTAENVKSGKEGITKKNEDSTSKPKPTQIESHAEPLQCKETKVDIDKMKPISSNENDSEGTLKDDTKSSYTKCNEKQKQESFALLECENKEIKLELEKSNTINNWECKVSDGTHKKEAIEKTKLSTSESKSSAVNNATSTECNEKQLENEENQQKESSVTCTNEIENNTTKILPQDGKEIYGMSPRNYN